MIDKEREKKSQKMDMSALNILMSQESDKKEDDDDDPFADEEAYKNMMARPLFNTDEDEEDQDHDDDEAKRKGVHWGSDVADKQRGDKKGGGMKSVTFDNRGSDGSTGIVALNMNRTKIGFDQEDYK